MGDIAEVQARMEALVREMVKPARDLAWQHATSWQTEARAIVALLPEPVDPDVLIAREIVNETIHWSSEAHRDTNSGKNDKSHVMQIALAAIKRGRHLAEQSK